MSVDVIVPAYNAALTIERTLASIAWQTHTNFHCYVIDDCSLDGTVEAVEAFAAKDDRFTLVTSVVRRYVAAARNAGATYGQAPWLAFCDADDTWYPSKLKYQLQALATQRAQAVLSAVKVEYPTAGEYTAGVKIKPDYFRPENLVGRLLSFNMAVCGSNLMVDRVAFDRVGRLDPEIAPSDDYDILFKLAHDGVRFAYDSRPGLIYHRNLESITQTEVPTATYYHQKCVDRWCKATGLSDDLFRDWALNLNEHLFAAPSRLENSRLGAKARKFFAYPYQSYRSLEEFLKADVEPLPPREEDEE